MQFLKIFLQSLVKLKLCVCLMQLTDAPDVVALNVLSLFIESCVWSISQSDVQTEYQAIRTFSFSVEITSIFSVEITWILDGQLLIIICPGQPMCSGHGICDAGLCICNAGINLFSKALSPSFTCAYPPRMCRHVVRHETGCYFNVRSKADISKINLPHGTNN